MSKIALVTGANKGIGFAAAHGLAKAGFHVFVAARDTVKGEQAAEKIRAEGYDAQFITIDVADEASVVAAAREIAAEWEGIDVLVNNAAINLDEGDGGILHTPLQTFEDTFKTNVWGVLLMTQAFWPLLQHGTSGRVINVSSGLGRLFDMENDKPAYASSKTAVNALTRQFADADENISVNCINPGWVKTDMGGQEAQRTPDQGAAIIIKLATMENPPNGQFLQDDGEIGW